MIDLKTCIAGVLLRPLLPFRKKGGLDHKNQAVNLTKKQGTSVQRKKTFLVVCFSILTAVLRGQTTPPARVDKIFPDHLQLTRRPLTFLSTAPVHLPAQTIPLPPSAIALPGGEDYVRHLGFFCRQELVIQRALRLPVFFRLGSLEYCNRLEGK